MKDALKTILSIAKIWLESTPARIAKYLIGSGIALISASWWQPIIQELITSHLNLNMPILTKMENAVFISGWFLIILGIVLLLFHKRISDVASIRIELSSHWWRRCLDDGITKHPDLFITVFNKSNREIPWLNMHIFPSNTYTLEPITERMDRLMPGQNAVYRFPVVDPDGNLTEEAHNFYAVAPDELSIRVFKSQSADDPLLINYPLGRELYDHIGNYLRSTA